MRKLTAFLVIVLVALGFVYVWWGNGMSAVNKFDKEKKIFVIKKQETVREIGNSLKKNGLIRDPVAFFVYLKIFSKDKNIQAGDYKLSPSMDLRAIVDNLNHGTLDKWITIPEGYRAQEIADLLKENMPNFKEEWRLNLAENEGYLFPDTYLIPKDAEIEGIISILRNNFDAKVKAIGVNENASNFARNLIIASLIEREARFREDMPLVSSVIHNRLAQGMPLQIDATVQYLLGYQTAERRWWKKDLTNFDLKIASPYNTYLNVGLPPTPISNPGILSLQAAISPSSTNYLYYVSDSKGHLHFAKNLEGHNLNIQKYIK